MLNFMSFYFFPPNVLNFCMGPSLFLSKEHCSKFFSLICTLFVCRTLAMRDRWTTACCFLSTHSAIVSPDHFSFLTRCFLYFCCSQNATGSPPEDCYWRNTTSVSHVRLNAKVHVWKSQKLGHLFALVLHDIIITTQRGIVTRISQIFGQNWAKIIGS